MGRSPSLGKYGPRYHVELRTRCSRAWGVRRRSVPLRSSEAARDEQRCHHVHRPRVKPEVAGDLIDRAGIGVEPGEEVDALERGDEHVVGIELIAGSVDRRGSVVGAAVRSVIRVSLLIFRCRAQS